jgi:hypothetical protein
LANAQAATIGEEGENNTESLRVVAALTKVANEAAATGLGLLNANKEQVARLSEPEAEQVKTLDDFYNRSSNP